MPDFFDSIGLIIRRRGLGPVLDRKDTRDTFYWWVRVYWLGFRATACHYRNKDKASGDIYWTQFQHLYNILSPEDQGWWRPGWLPFVGERRSAPAKETEEEWIRDLKDDLKVEVSTCKLHLEAEPRVQ